METHWLKKSKSCKLRGESLRGFIARHFKFSEPYGNQLANASSVKYPYLCTEVDVLVIGLGPTAVTLAALLGHSGIRVAGFDKSADMYPLPRAIGLDHEVMLVKQGNSFYPSTSPS
jgi:FAD binding domain